MWVMPPSKISSVNSAISTLLLVAKIKDVSNAMYVRAMFKRGANAHCVVESLLSCQCMVDRYGVMYGM